MPPQRQGAVGDAPEIGREHDPDVEGRVSAKREPVFQEIMLRKGRCDADPIHPKRDHLMPSPEELTFVVGRLLWPFSAMLYVVRRITFRPISSREHNSTGLDPLIRARFVLSAF